MEEKLLSMSEIAKLCPYEKGYLSLLARRGEIKAKKVGKNWFTTVEWLNEYIRKKKPDKIIRLNTDEKFTRKRFFQPVLFFSGLFLLVFLFLIAGYFWKKNQFLKEKEEQFITEEILKIPNEDGGYDVYEGGRRKIGKEMMKNSSDF